MQHQHAQASTGKRPCPVAGIGASAGGLGAFKTFFSNMPIDSGIAFVLVPHLDPTHRSLMDELLGRHTGMPVCEAEDGMKVECNHVYIIPPARYLSIRDHTLHLSTPSEPRGAQTAIDNFLRSLAQDQQELAIGIILSGTGSHGTPGLKEIKLAGGMVMAQEPASAEYEQMPRSAIATGLVDYVLPPEQMSTALLSYVTQPYLYTAADAETVADQEREQINRILAVLRSRSRHDFRSYRRKMLVRRIQRRMGLVHIGNFSDYLDYLREHTEEITALCKDMLIGVTGFFRDADAFEILSQRVLPELVESHVSTAGEERPVRVWVPGCATGEEAYTIAMLLIEQFVAMNISDNIQIFASDIDEAALEIARQGVYPNSVVADISPQRLQRFFVRTDDHQYRVSKQLREAIVFAPQNLISDAPFSKLDLVSCRNLLIYIQPEVQEKVISLFHFALNENGYLLLGPSESIGRALDMFEPVSKKWRVYRRIGPTRTGQVEIPIVNVADTQGRSVASQTQPPLKLAGLMQRVLLEDYAPASVLVNRKYDILCFQGPTVNYLEFPSGEPTQNLMSMARQGLQTRIRAACHRAIQLGRSVIDDKARVRRDDGYVRCSIRVKPLNEPKQAEGLLLVTFLDLSEPAAPVTIAQPGSESGDADLVRQLEFELKATREDLQGTIEELESSNEELKASNEEVMSMNEELQSTNEELETSKEEMQSLNEELSTLNQQLLDKVEELDTASNDITNLLTSSEVATVFLDSGLRIKRFTPPAEKLLNLLAGDMGRPFGDFAASYHDATLLDDCRHVLDTLRPIEKEICASNRHSYLRRILPYRTADNRIDGVVIIFIDITERAAAEAQSRLLATTLRNSNDAVTVQDFDGNITVWNRGAERMYGYEAAQALKMNIRETVPEDRRAEMLQLVRRIAAGEDIQSFETLRVTRDGRTLDVWLTITPVLDDSGARVGLSTTERDISASNRASEELQRLNEQLEQKIAERTSELQRREEEFRALADNVPAMFSYLDADQRYRYVNRRYEEFWRRPAAEVIGITAAELLGPADYALARPHIEAVLAGTPVTYEAVFEFIDRNSYMQVTYVPDTDVDGRVQGFYVLVNDITELKRAERALQEREDRLRVILDTAPDAIISIDNDGMIMDYNHAAEMIFGYSASEIIGRNVSQLMPSPYREEHNDYIARYLETGKSIVFCRRREVVGRRKHGETFPMELTVSEIDHIGMFVGIARDISAKRQLEQEVAKASTYEQERIGQEIHDGLGQRLTGLSLLATSLKGELADRGLAEAGIAQEIVEQLHQAIKEARTIAHGLSPLPLETGGLEEALAGLAEDTQATTGITCRFEAHDGLTPLIEDHSVAMQIYRIAQEAVHNTVKHARARTITIRLAVQDDLPELLIEDDGRGFDVESETSEGHGLRILHYRAGIIGCNLTIVSAPGSGTSIRCRFGA